MTEKTDKELISYREFARRMVVSDTAVRKAVKSGRIKIDSYDPKTKNPLLDAAQAAIDWRNNTNPGLQRVGKGGSGIIAKDSPLNIVNLAPPPSEYPVPKKAGRPRKTVSTETVKEPENVKPEDSGGEKKPEAAETKKPNPETVPTDPETQQLPLIDTYGDSRAKTETYKALLMELEYKEKTKQLISPAEALEVVREEYMRVRNKLTAMKAKLVPELAIAQGEAEIRQILDRNELEILKELSADTIELGERAA